MAKPAKSPSEPLAKTHAPLLARLCGSAEASAAAFGGVDRVLFASALERSAAHRFPSGASSEPVAEYLDSLHLSDLALACACAEGREAAWDHFVCAFRPDLYAAARAICANDETAARELADSLYAELFGVRGESAQRRSLFDYYHGRSKLSTWLRSILAQRRVDQVRAARRMEPLDDNHGEDSAEVAAALLRNSANAGSADPDRPRYLALLQAALTAALAALPARDRLRLSYYYLRDLTLAQIGKLLGEHEATASRHLDRTRRELRKHVERALREEKRLSEAQIKLCYEYALEEWPFDLSRVLNTAEADQ
jgi:RNA polymerase sigma-70 factor (ECF subfamily)